MKYAYLGMLPMCANFKNNNNKVTFLVKMHSTFDFVCATYKVSVFFLLLTMTAYGHTDDGMEHQRA